MIVWMTAHRARAYCRVITIMTGVMLLLRIAGGLLHLGPFGFALSSDFVSFWAASRLALDGHPADVYVPAVHWPVQRAVLGPDIGYSAFFYPPIWLLFCLPLALLPFWVSLAVYLVLTALAYWCVLRLVLPMADSAIWAFPAVALNVIFGQNGLQSTALYGLGLLLLARWPVLSGFCFACLAYKPHLGLVLPIALLVLGQWRAAAAATIGVLLLALASLALFGWQTWKNFLAGLPLSRQILENGLVNNIAWASVFRAVRELGGSVKTAYVAQLLVAGLAVSLMVLILRRSPNAVTAAVPLAALLCTPFLLAYDLALLAVPLAWLTLQGAAQGFLQGEKVAIALGFLLPVLAVLGSKLALPWLAPLILIGLFIVVLRRVNFVDHHGRTNLLAADDQRRERAQKMPLGSRNRAKHSIARVETARMLGWAVDLGLGSPGALPVAPQRSREKLEFRAFGAGAVDATTAPHMNDVIIPPNYAATPSTGANGARPRIMSDAFSAIIIVELVSIRRRHAGHDRCIYDPDPLQPMHPQFVIHHRRLVRHRPHPRRADQMIRRRSVLPSVSPATRRRYAHRAQAENHHQNKVPAPACAATAAPSACP